MNDTLDFSGRTVIVTGVGRAGQIGNAVALSFGRAGAKIVAVQDSKGTLFKKSGLDVARVKAAHDGEGVPSCADGECIAQEQFWDVDCDILIPAALEAQSADIATFARAEGLEAHARAVEVRSPTRNVDQ